MKTLAALLLLTVSANAQQVNNATVNNATVNIIGNNQNVVVSQSGVNHTVNLNLNGNDIPVNVTQSGILPQNFNLSVTCYSNCAGNPIVVNQY